MYLAAAIRKINRDIKRRKPTKEIIQKSTQLSLQLKLRQQPKHLQGRLAAKLGALSRSMCPAWCPLAELSTTGVFPESIAKGSSGKSFEH